MTFVAFANKYLLTYLKSLDSYNLPQTWYTIRSVLAHTHTHKRTEKRRIGQTKEWKKTNWRLFQSWFWFQFSLHLVFIIFSVFCFIAHCSCCSFEFTFSRSACKGEDGRAEIWKTSTRINKTNRQKYRKRVRERVEWSVPKFPVEIGKMNNAHNLNILCVRCLSKWKTPNKSQIGPAVRNNSFSFRFEMGARARTSAIDSAPAPQSHTHTHFACKWARTLCQLAFALCVRSVYTVKIIEHAQTKRLSDSMWPNSFNASIVIVVGIGCSVWFMFFIFSRSVLSRIP